MLMRASDWADTSRLLSSCLHGRVQLSPLRQVLMARGELGEPSSFSWKGASGHCT